MNTIIIKNVTSGTLSNTEGAILFCAIDFALKSNIPVLLSFESINTISSSFLNSSIGNIVDKYGFTILKDNLKITNYTKPIAATLVKYISDLKAYSKS